MANKELYEKLDREEFLKDLSFQMSSVEGRRFVWRLLGDTGLFRPSFIAGAADVTAFNEGSRNFGLGLLGEIMSNEPEGYLIMQKEAIDHEQKKKLSSGDGTRAEAHGDIRDGVTDHR